MLELRGDELVALVRRVFKTRPEDTGIAVLVTVLFGTFLGENARRRAIADKTVSSTVMSASAMAFGTVAYLALAALAAYTFTAVNGL